MSPMYQSQSELLCRQVPLLLMVIQRSRFFHIVTLLPTPPARALLTPSRLKLNISSRSSFCEGGRQKPCLVFLLSRIQKLYTSHLFTSHWPQVHQTTTPTAREAQNCGHWLGDHKVKLKFYYKGRRKQMLMDSSLSLSKIFALTPENQKTKLGRNNLFHKL